MALLVVLSTSSSAFAELRVRGVDGDLAANIRALVTLESEPCDAPSWLVKRRYRELEGQVREALEPFGYYAPTVTSALSINQDCWRADVDVDPGMPVRIRNFELRLANDAAQADFSDLLKLKKSLRPGAVLHHADYTALKRDFMIRAADRGYFDGRFATAKLDIWPDDLAADATLTFDSGERYRVGEIRVEETALQSDLVRRYAQLVSGSPYDSDVVAQAYRELSASGYFDTVEVSAVFEEAADGVVPVRIALDLAPRVEYTAGIGASTDIGPRFRTGYNNNRLTARGQRLALGLSLSPVVQGVNAEYRFPLGDPRREWFSITAAASRENVDTFESDVLRLGVRWTRAFSEHWLRTYSLDGSVEDFEVGGDADQTRLLVGGIVIDRKASDRDVFPRSGYRLGLGLQGAHRYAGSSVDFLQATAWARWVKGLGKRSRLIARGNLGLTVTSDFEELPPGYRFFAGGDQSIRGFGYNRLGPEDADGEVSGGTRLVVGSLEWERRLKGSLYGAVFVDAGNAFERGDFPIETGAGLGLKWRSPVGPLRLYVGHPLSGGADGVRVHVQLGADL